MMKVLRISLRFGICGSLVSYLCEAERTTCVEVAAQTEMAASKWWERGQRIYMKCRVGAGAR